MYTSIEAAFCVKHREIDLLEASYERQIRTGQWPEDFVPWHEDEVYAQEVVKKLFLLQLSLLRSRDGSTWGRGTPQCWFWVGQILPELVKKDLS